MAKIEKIYVCCHRAGVYLARICVASIRYWYPSIPVVLIKDTSKGDFSTVEIEKNWDVSVLKTKGKYFFWGFIKYEALFLKNGERVLVIDCDIIFLGKVLEILEQHNEDFIVSEEKRDNPKTDGFKNTYFDFDLLRKYDPSYIYPGYAFNGGQIVGVCGKLEPKDFNGVVAWRDKPVKKRGDIFAKGDQGITNYILAKKKSLGLISVKPIKFMRWSFGLEINKYELSKIINREGYPLLMHWAGLKKPVVSMLPRSDLLLFYEDYYYSKIKCGAFLHVIRKYEQWMEYPIFLIKRFIIRFKDKHGRDFLSSIRRKCY